MGGRYKLTGEVEKKSLKILKDITDLLDTHDIPYCLEGGTLLGIVREKRLLPWDDDVDITITADQFNKAKTCLRKVALKYRLKFRFVFEDFGPLKAGAPRIIKILDRRFFFFRGQVQLDIFVKHSDGKDYYWVIGRSKEYAVKSVPEKYYKELTTIEFDNKQYSIPKEYREYLTLRYGEWEQPVKEWNNLTDDRAKVSGT